DFPGSIGSMRGSRNAVSLAPTCTRRGGWVNQAEHLQKHSSIRSCTVTCPPAQAKAVSAGDFGRAGSRRPPQPRQTPSQRQSRTIYVARRAPAVGDENVITRDQANSRLDSK